MNQEPTDALRELLSQRLIDLSIATPRAPNDARRDMILAGQLIDAIKAQAWQDGHDTALINGQSENPYDHAKDQKRP